WTTSITLVNLGKMPSSFQLSFLGSRGFREAWPISLTAPGATIINRSVNAILEPGASIEVQTRGDSEKMTRGYAVLSIFDGPRVGATARLQRTVNGVAETAFTVPLSPEFEGKSNIPVSFGELDSTELVLVSDTSSTVVDLIFRDLAGKEVLADSLTFGDLSQMVVSLGTRYPQLKGTRGTLEWSVSFPGADIYEDLTFSAVALGGMSSGKVAVVPAMTLPENQGKKSQH
ncbi:MAG: hypothetical protein H7Y20_12430, partial [Bryobacteraceae bacterium]|nr:hypothetical protein [Bryobacteraceae bacterium]